MGGEGISEVRLIDANALKERLTPIKLYDGIYCKVITEKDIDDAPTVPLSDFKEGYKQAILDGKTNYSRPKGEWKHIIEEDNDVECPFCGFQEDGIYYNFCPGCGADMRGDKQ